MRLSVASLRRVVKRDLAIQFVPQALTSYGGLELLRRYLRRLDLTVRLRAAFTGLPSDYGSPRLALVLLALFYVGARRLEHLRFLSGDPRSAASAAWRGCRRGAPWRTGSDSSRRRRWRPS